jgi:hypothetical protein
LQRSVPPAWQVPEPSQVPAFITVVPLHTGGVQTVSAA